jgi:oligoribonuclease
MTGLDPDNETIMSLACFVTDHDLNIVDEDGYEAIIHHSKEDLDCMGEWCTEHHGDSGLTAACVDSTTTAEQAAEGLLQYIKQHVPNAQPYNVVMDYLHYRILDVSSIKEAARRWAPPEVLRKAPKKKMLHEARADILESIEEAKFYREAFFVKKT